MTFDKHCLCAHKWAVYLIEPTIKSPKSFLEARITALTIFCCQDRLSQPGSLIFCPFSVFNQIKHYKTTERSALNSFRTYASCFDIRFRLLQKFQLSIQNSQLGIQISFSHALFQNTMPLQTVQKNGPHLKHLFLQTPLHFPTWARQIFFCFHRRVSKMPQNAGIYSVSLF